jgi:hypothetical protein
VGRKRQRNIKKIQFKEESKSSHSGIFSLFKDPTFEYRHRIVAKYLLEVTSNGR